MRNININTETTFEDIMMLYITAFVLMISVAVAPINGKVMPNHTILVKEQKLYPTLEGCEIDKTVKVLFDSSIQKYGDKVLGSLYKDCAKNIDANPINHQFTTSINGNIEFNNPILIDSGKIRG